MFKKITFERTMCYGSCPTYKVQMDDDGIVKWNGIEYVSKIGHFEWKLTTKKITQLSSLIEAFNFRNYKYQPLGLVATDHASCIITIEYMDGFIKEVDHYLGEQLEDENSVESGKLSLLDFEKKMEMIIGTKKYIKEPLHIFRFEYTGDRLAEDAYKGHVVVANNERNAISMIPLGSESQNEQGGVPVSQRRLEH